MTPMNNDLMEEFKMDMIPYLAGNHDKKDVNR